MNTEQRHKQLRKLTGKSYWQALKEEFDLKIKKMQDLSDIESYEEMLGKKKAKEILDKMIYKIDNLGKKVEGNKRERYD